MNDSAKKHKNDCRKYEAPLSTFHKPCWKTIKLPLASTMKRPDENNIVDMDGKVVLKLRGGIEEERLNFMSSKIEVDLIDPSTNAILLHISRVSKFWNELFTATPVFIGSENAPHTMELLQGPFCRNYTLKKVDPRNTESFKIFMRCQNAKKKELLMVRDLFKETIEYGPGISLEEAVFVGYAMDWLTCPREDPITDHTFASFDIC